jgi:hypothetical protein
VSAIKDKAAKIWERDPLDWYVEDSHVTKQLLGAERFTGPIADPCCGANLEVGGNIVRACIEAGYDAHGFDVEDRFGDTAFPSWWRGTQDFLKVADLPSFTNIIMNPPYFGGVGAEAFIRKALAVATGKVAAFVDVRFIGSSRRAVGLWREHRPSRIHYITPRPSCPPGAMLLKQGRRGGGTADYCWVVWDENRPARFTEMNWLTDEVRA